MLNINCVTPPQNYGIYEVLEGNVDVKKGWYFVDWRDGMPDMKWGQFTLLGHSESKQQTINLAWQDFYKKKKTTGDKDGVQSC